MDTVGVELKKVRVDSFSVSDESVVLELSFNDGCDKQVFKTINMGDTKEIAAAVISEIMRMESNINAKFDGEMLAPQLRIVVNDAEEKQKKLLRFLEEVNAKMQRIKNRKSSEGYVDLLREMGNVEAEL